MKNKIEMLNRIRKNTLLVILVGAVISFALFMFPSFNTLFHFTRGVTWGGAMIIFYISISLLFFSFLVFISRYWFYRNKLKKDLSLPVAVNDERIKLCWLRAYRFSFFIVVFLAIFWKWEESGFYPELWRTKMPLPYPPLLIIYGAGISLVASFLWYSRDVKRKESI